MRSWDVQSLEVPPGSPLPGRCWLFTDLQLTSEAMSPSGNVIQHLDKSHILKEKCFGGCFLIQAVYLGGGLGY